MKKKNGGVILVTSIIVVLVIIVIALLIILLTGDNKKNDTFENETEYSDDNKDNKDENVFKGTNFVIAINYNKIVGFDNDANDFVIVNNIKNTKFDVNDNKLYYVSNDNNIHRIDLDGKNDADLGIPNENNYLTLRVTDKYIVFLKNDSYSVIVDKETKQRKEVEFRTNNYSNYKYKNNIIYMDKDKEGIYLFNLDTLSKTPIETNHARIVALNSNYLVYEYSNNYNIYIYDLDARKEVTKLERARDSLGIDVVNAVQSDILVKDNHLYVFSEDSLIDYTISSRLIRKLYTFDNYDYSEDFIFLTDDNGIIIVRKVYKNVEGECFDVGPGACTDYVKTEIIKYDIEKQNIKYLKSSLLGEYGNIDYISYIK